MKKILISLLSIIFIISMITNVYAATGNINSGVNTDTVYKGKTFTITLTGTSDKPIEGMGTTLEYNSNELKLKSVTAAQGYEKISSGSESNIAISITSGSTAQQSATLCTIEFEVLETTDANTTTVKFNNSSLVIPDEEDTTISRDLSCTISAVTVNLTEDDTTAGGNQGSTNGEGDQNPSNGDNGTGDDGNSNSGNEEKNENTNKNVNSNKNTNKNTTKLPQTGAESTVVIAIVALGIVSIVSYISYRKYNNI